MICVVVESPLSAPSRVLRTANLAYAKRAILDCLRRNESPIASHVLLAQPDVLDDFDPEQRTLGMSAGWRWIERADIVAVYTDRGISSGMKQGIAVADAEHVPVVYRSIEQHCLNVSCVPRPCFCDCGTCKRPLHA